MNSDPHLESISLNTIMNGSDSSFYETPLNSPNQSFYRMINESGTSDYQCSDFDADDRMSPCDSIKTMVPSSTNDEINMSSSYMENINNYQPSSIKTNQIKASNPHQHYYVKFNTILKHLKFIQTECSKAQMYERQLLDLCQQIKEFRENLSREHFTIVKTLNELMDGISWKNSNNSFPSSIIHNRTFSDPLVENSHLESITDHQIHSNRIILNDHLKYKFRKLPAMIKGYLVRRLMKTEKVSSLRRTIFDTCALLINFKQNLTTNDGQLVVTQEDVLFHKRLCVQLERSCTEFYSIFFRTPVHKQMQIISRHREHIRTVSLRESRDNSLKSQLSVDSTRTTSSKIK